MNTWTKLKYGFVIASSLTATGVVMYLTPTKYIKSVDMVEIALGCQERCLVTQQGINPNSVMVTQTLVHARHTWTNTPYPWHEYGTNGSRTTNYLVAASNCYTVTNNYLTEWWSPAAKVFSVGGTNFSIYPISYGQYFASNTGLRMLSAGFTNINISGMSSLATYSGDNKDGGYILVGRYKGRGNTLADVVKSNNTNAPTLIFEDPYAYSYFGQEYDLWVNVTNGTTIVDYGQREGRPLYDITSEAGIALSIKYARSMFGIYFTWPPVGGVGLLTQYGYEHTWGLDCPLYGPMHIYSMGSGGDKYVLPTITKGAINEAWIKSAPVYDMYYVPSNPISRYVNGDDLYTKIAERTYLLADGNAYSKYLQTTTNSDGIYTGYYQNVTSAEMPYGFPRVIRTNLFAQLNITNYFIDVWTNAIADPPYVAFTASNTISSNGWHMKRDVLAELEYTEDNVTQSKYVTKCWQGFSTNSWADAKVVAFTNYTITTNQANIDDVYSTAPTAYYKAGSGNKWTYGARSSPNGWYAIAMSEESTLVTYCNTNIGRDVYWYHASRTPSNVSDIANFNAFYSTIASNVFYNNSEQVVSNLEWYYESKSATNIFHNVVTNVFGDLNIGVWCNEPIWVTSLADSTNLFRGFLKPYSKAIAKWNFQYCTNN